MRGLLLLSFCFLICYLHLTSSAKSKKPAKEKPKKPAVRTPFDTVLEKLSKCAAESPSLIDVMQENFVELQSDEKYASLFQAAPHTTAFLNQKKKNSKKYIRALQQALTADWSHPKWKSTDQIETLFRPLKQQFVYAMMRSNWLYD